MSRGTIVPASRRGTRRVLYLGAVSFAFLPVISLGLPSGAETRPARTIRFHVETLDEGIFVFRPNDERGRSNSLVVDRADGLLVVDAQPTPEAARELLEAIASTTPKPLRYLVLTHPHAEAMGGAPAFPETALRIASVACRDALADPAHDFGAELRLRAGGDPTWKELERRMPVLSVSSSVFLEDPRNPVELVPLEAAHSKGDLIVSLPRAGVVAAGHLVFPDRNPYAEDARLGNWLNALNNLASMRSKAIVPLRGRVIDDLEVRRERDALAWVRGQITQGYLDLLPSEKIPETILLSKDLANHFDPEAKPSFLPGLFRVALREAQIERRKRGLE